MTQHSTLLKTASVGKKPSDQGRGRPRSFDPDLILDRASTIFARQGYHGTSVTDLTAATGLSQGSLYKAFTDKRTLFLAVVRRYRAIKRQALLDACTQAQTGRERVRAALLYYAGNSCDERGREGCLIVTGATDLSTFDRETADEIVAARTTLEDFLAEAIGQGQTDQSLSSDLDPQACAKTLVCLCHGMRVVGKTGVTRPEMESVVTQAMQIVHR